MNPDVWLAVAVVILLAATDRPCPGCGRWFRHTLVCRRRPL